MNHAVPTPNVESPLGEIFLEGIARGTERLLQSPEFTDRLADKVADRVALLFELLEPKVAAGLLDVTTATLNNNHVDWRLDKSVAFGLTNPRFFLSQVIARSREKVLKGKREKGAVDLIAAELERRYGLKRPPQPNHQEERIAA